MDTYAARVAALAEKHIFSALPVLGSGDLLDRAVMSAAINEFDSAVYSLADRVKGSAAVAGRRVSAHARSEVGRMLNLAVPNDIRAKAAIDQFAIRNVELLRNVGARQAQKMREALANYDDASSLRELLKGQLWVSRNQAKLLAYDQPFKFHAETVREWSEAVGSETYIWTTKRDARCRPGHQRLDGSVRNYKNPPDTGRQEGRNNPGQAIRCRCVAVPVEATYE